MNKSQEPVKQYQKPNIYVIRAPKVEEKLQCGERKKERERERERQKGRKRKTKNFQNLTKHTKPTDLKSSSNHKQDKPKKINPCPKIL